MLLKLIQPLPSHQAKAEEFKREFIKYHFSQHGFGGMERYDDYLEWLAFMVKQKDEKNVTQGRVPAETLFVVNKKEDKIIGIVDIRYRLNDYLLQIGGHIGISIRPKYRNRGLGTQALKLALERCKELCKDRVLITCNKTNQASAKMIINNGGVFENEVVEEDGTILQRYWIDNK